MPPIMDDPTCFANRLHAENSDFLFTVDHVYPKAEIFENHLREIKGREGLRYLEVGVFEALSAIWFMKNILSAPSSTAVLIDSFEDEHTAAIPGNLRAAGLEKRCQLVRGKSQIELRKLPADGFDLIFIDGAHDRRAVIEDLVLAWPLLKKSGYMILDDYLLEMGDEPPEKDPRPAMDFFLETYKNSYRLLYKEFFIILQKKED